MRNFFTLFAVFIFYDKPLFLEEEVPKLLRISLACFRFNLCVGQSQQLAFKKVTALVKAKISWQKKQNLGKPVPPVTETAFLTINFKV